MIWVSIMLGVFLFISTVGVALSRSSKAGRITLLDWALIGIGLVYGLGWVSVIWLTQSGKNPQWERWIVPHEDYFLVHNVLAFVLALSIAVGWVAAARISPLSRRVAGKYITPDAERLHAFAWGLLALSFGLRWLYVDAYGGFLNYLNYSAAIRSAIFEVSNPFSFLQPFGGVAIFSSFLFLASIYSGKKTALKFVGLALSVSFAVYVLYSLLGRVAFLIYISTIVLSSLYMRAIRPKIVIVFGILGSIAAILATYLISELSGIKGADSASEYVARELSFPFVSFFSQLDSGQNLYRWYVDFVWAPLYFLPSSVWSLWVDDVSQVNTAVVLGARKGDFGISGGIPVDLMTLGIMQSHVFGVVAVGALFGALIRGVQGFLDGLHSTGLRNVLGAYVAIRVAVYAIPYAHPLHLIGGTFGDLFSLTLLMFLSLISRVRINDRKL